jgi:hypothetical protein
MKSGDSRSINRRDGRCPAHLDLATCDSRRARGTRSNKAAAHFQNGILLAPITAKVIPDRFPTRGQA